MNDWRITLVEGRAASLAALAFDPAEAVAGPFQHPDWLAAWGETFGAEPGARVFVALVAEAASGRVVLRQPLSLETISGVRILRGWDRGVADYGGPILAADFRPTVEAARGLWAALRRALPACDLVVFDKLPARIGDRPQPLLCGIGTVARSLNAAHPMVLGGAAIDPTLSRSLARKRRKLANKGELVFRLAAAAEAREPLERLFDWRRTRFAEVNDAAFVASVESFWRRLAASPIARVATLTLDGRLLAAGFGTCTGATFQLLATGFDPVWKNWSPGLVMAEDLAAALVAEGVEVLDFTIGAEAYKRDFAADPQPLCDLFVPFTLKGRLAGWWRRRQVARRLAATAGPAT